NFSSSGWHICASSEQRVLQAVCARGISLNAVAGKVFSGIKTGCARAYVIDSKTRKELEKRGAAPTCLKRLLLPTDIQQWVPQWSGHHLIVVAKGEVLDERDPIYHHLSQFRSEL